MIKGKKLTHDEEHLDSKNLMLKRYGDFSNRSNKKTLESKVNEINHIK